MHLNVIISVKNINMFKYMLIYFTHIYINVSLCLHVCICQYIGIFKCIYIYICKHVYMYICMCICIYVCIYVRIYVCNYICVCM